MSLPNLSHLWDPRAHSFIHFHDIQNTLCLGLSCKGLSALHTITHMQAGFSPACEELMILHLSYQTPVSLLSANQRGEGNSPLTWNQSGPGSEGNHNTWLICVSLVSSASLTHTHTPSERSSHTHSDQLKRKDPIPADLDWRHDQRDWVSVVSIPFFHILKYVLHPDVCAFYPQNEEKKHCDTKLYFTQRWYFNYFGLGGDIPPPPPPSFS